MAQHAAAVILHALPLTTVYSGSTKSTLDRTGTFCNFSDAALVAKTEQSQGTLPYRRLADTGLIASTIAEIKSLLLQVNHWQTRPGMST